MSLHLQQLILTGWLASLLMKIRFQLTWQISTSKSCLSLQVWAIFQSILAKSDEIQQDLVKTQQVRPARLWPKTNCYSSRSTWTDSSYRSTPGPDLGDPSDRVDSNPFGLDKNPTRPNPWTTLLTICHIRVDRLFLFFLNLLVGEVIFEFDVFINTKKKKKTNCGITLDSLITL